MIIEKIQKANFVVLLITTLLASLTTFYLSANEIKPITRGNFGLPGILDLPTARRLPDGELILTHQNHEYIFMNGLSFQALPRLGLSFRYTGIGRGGNFAQDRVVWDRSFDAHLSVVDEGKYLPALSIGLRDFIGTGWYSSEYLVGTKSFGNLELTAGLGFGRLAGRDSFSNPFGTFSSKFNERQQKKESRGGTLSTINWFQGDAAAFYGLSYHFGDKIIASAEYSTDIMSLESSFLDVTSPWNFGVSISLTIT